jgi:hypothetical protein
MKRYCYIIVNNAGHSWPALNTTDNEPPRDQSTPVLSMLLDDGWVPVRETPMGGGTSHLAHSLVLLEKEAATQKPVKGRRKSS